LGLALEPSPKSPCQTIAYEPGRHYAGFMTYPPDIVAGTLNVLIGPRAERAAMLELTAMLALRGPVQILDGGNSFDAYRVARLVRRQTPHLNETLERIHVARAFTCYQVLTLFRQTPAGPAPQLIFDLLATFYDESITLEESHRLLRVVLGHLYRLRREAPVAVSLSRPHQPERAGLVDVLAAAADQVLIRDTPLPPVQGRLF
jgi:hypothetical protein